jgi:hypothetical protein
MAENVACYSRKTRIKFIIRLHFTLLAEKEEQALCKTLS